MVVAATALGTAAVIVFAVLPVLTGVMADRFALDDVAAGLVGTAYFSAYALVALTSSLWIRRWSWRRARLAGFLCMLVGLSFCIVAPAFVLVCLALAVVGVGAALLFPISLTLVSDMTHTDRTYAIKTSVEQLIPAALLFTLSSALFADTGQTALLLTVLVLVAACLLFSGALPAAGRPTVHVAGGANRSAVLSLLTLLALAVNFAGFAGLWAFLERLGVERHFDAAFINGWLAVGLIMSGLGPLGAAVLEDRIGRVWPLLGATGLALGALSLLAHDDSRTGYAAVLTILPLGYYFAITYMLSVIAAADHNGRMAGQMSFALAAGAAAGPLLFGYVRSADGSVLLSMGALIATGAALMAWTAYRLGTGAPEPQESHQSGATT